MRDVLWLVRFDFKTGWRWHTVIFISLLALSYGLLRFGNVPLADYFDQPLIMVDIFYMLFISGWIVVFMYRENLLPKRRSFNNYAIPFMQLIRTLPVSSQLAVRFYFTKFTTSIVLFNIVIAMLIFPLWSEYMSIGSYVYFNLFWLGIGFVIGLWTLVAFSVRGYLVFMIASVVGGYFIVMTMGIIVFYKVFHGGIIGVVVEAIVRYGYILPASSLLLALLSWFIGEKIMIRLIERAE